MNEMCFLYTLSSKFLSCIFLFCILSSVSYGDETDHLALLSIKKHITSDPYQIMPLWNDSIHFCNWTGIVCDHQRVISLNLGYRGFSGSISAAVGNLTFLRELRLHCNDFTGKVPQEVGRLSRLRRLDIWNNSLSDLVAHLGDFGLAKFVHPDFSTSHTSSLGIKGTIGYAAPEYGMGSKVSTYGDVYSYGILILELFTSNRPTDDMFRDGLSLHSFVKMAIPDRVIEITDPVLFETGQEEKITSDARDCKMHDGIKDCLTSVYGIGIACSMEMPGDRIEISNALKQLLFVKKTFLKK